MDFKKSFQGKVDFQKSFRGKVDFQKGRNWRSCMQLENTSWNMSRPQICSSSEISNWLLCQIQVIFIKKEPELAKQWISLKHYAMMMWLCTIFSPQNVLLQIPKHLERMWLLFPITFFRSWEKFFAEIPQFFNCRRLGKQSNNTGQIHLPFKNYIFGIDIS